MLLYPIARGNIPIRRFSPPPERAVSTATREIPARELGVVQHVSPPGAAARHEWSGDREDPHWRRRLRDARALAIPDGTTEIQKLVVGRAWTGIRAFT